LADRAVKVEQDMGDRPKELTGIAVGHGMYSRLTVFHIMSNQR
jgi:hypothetical protein